MQIKSKSTLEQFFSIHKNRFIWIVPFLVLSVIFVLIVSESLSVWQQEAVVLKIELWNIVAIIATSIGFILCKSASLFYSARATGANIRLKDAAKLLTQSVLVEITMFPSKLAGDTFKYFRLPGRNQTQKVMTVMIFRCTSFAPFLLLLFLYPDSIYSWVFCGCLLTAFIWLLAKKLQGHISWTALFLSTCGHFFALLFWSCQGYLLLRLLSPSPPSFLAFVGIFLIVQIAASVSNLPFGIGVKEVLFGFTLSSFLGADQMIIFLILLRLSGELLTASIGWLTLLPEIIQRRPPLRESSLYDQQSPT